MTETQQSRPIVVAGGRGFIGTALVQQLKARGDEVVVVSRTGGGTHAGAPVYAYQDLDTLRCVRGVINLAGADIAGRRWSQARKQELRESRLNPTRALCAWVRGLQAVPECFINASAIGYYGPTGDVPVSEADLAGNDFGAQLCRDWEAAIEVPNGCRTVIFRIAVVLGPGGGALQRMLPPFRWGLGGPLGSGQQWMSWIALADLLALIIRSIDDPQWHGAYNAVAPQTVRNREFAKTLGQVLQRPAVLPLPACVLRGALGEMSGLLLAPQRIETQRLSEHAFTFKHAALESALHAAVRA